MPKQFDHEKDKTLWAETFQSGLEISVKVYDGGQPKLQIGPRWKERNGERIATKPGRLTLEEFEDIVSLFEDIKSCLRK